jgi:hypothetical protein
MATATSALAFGAGADVRGPASARRHGGLGTEGAAHERRRAKRSHSGEDLALHDKEPDLDLILVRNVG